MDEIKTLIKYIENSEEKYIIDQIKQYKNFLDISGVNSVEIKINPRYGFEEYVLTDLGGNIIDDSKCTNCVYNINDLLYKRISYIYDIKDYLKNLNIIYFKHLSPFGVYCDGLTLCIDKDKLEEFSQKERNIIIAFYALLPLMDIYSIGKKGYNGTKGNYEKFSLTFLLKYLGFSNEKLFYSISKRHEQGKSINGIEFILPPNHFKIYNLSNFLNTDNPFFKITKKTELYTNPNKYIIEITQKSLKVNQVSGVHREYVTFIAFIENDNKLINKQDQDVKDYLLSEKMLTALML